MITVAFICAGAVLLLLFGDQISARRRARAAAIARHPSGRTQPVIPRQQRRQP